MHQVDRIDALLCTKHHRQAKCTVQQQQRHKWGTGQWNTYGQLPRKCCEEEEISKWIESESQEVRGGFALVLLGWCLSSFHTLICVNAVMDSAAQPWAMSWETLWQPLILLYAGKSQRGRTVPRATQHCSVTPLIMYMMFPISPEGK